MSTHEITLPKVQHFTGACDAVIGYTVHDASKKDGTYITVESVQSKQTRFDMLPAIEANHLLTLKLRLSEIEANKALAA